MPGVPEAESGAAREPPGLPPGAHKPLMLLGLLLRGPLHMGQVSGALSLEALDGGWTASSDRQPVASRC